MRTVSGSDEPWAAIGTLRAADLYGVPGDRPDIEDTEDNSTRFVLLGREPVAAVGAGRFRTSIICALERDRPGALLAILQEFAMRAVNLTQAREPAHQDRASAATSSSSTSRAAATRDLPVDAAITAIEQQGVARVTFLGLLPGRRRGLARLPAGSG